MNSIGPTTAAFDAHWPAADVANLLDGSLYLDRSRGTADETELASRIDRLLRYSASTGAEGILFTGSFFGDAVKRARDTIGIPVLTSFEGLIDRALDLDQPLHVVATAADSVTLLTDELEREASSRSRRVSLSGHAVAGAMDALIGGDPDVHDRLVLDAVAAAVSNVAVVFAQFSMERVLERCAAQRVAPVIGPAREGVARLRRLLGSEVPQ